MKCVICETRKPRRYCPGVRGEICAICCGEGRENTIACPLDCVYLEEARLHEKPLVSVDFEKIPFAEIRIPERFVDDHSTALYIVTSAVVKAVGQAPAAVDYDVRQAVEALIQTYKTLQSGLIYESRPANPIAAAIMAAIEEDLAESRNRAKTEGVSVRDSEILLALVIVQRREYFYNNGRRRGRAFIDTMREMFPDAVAVNPAGSSLIV